VGIRYLLIAFLFDAAPIQRRPRNDCRWTLSARPFAETPMARVDMPRRGDAALAASRKIQRE
jgi:hypothetical protein